LWFTCRPAWFISAVVIGGIVFLILLVNLLVMIFARRLDAIMGTGLSVVGAVLGVVQVALGLRIIYKLLLALHV
jgi:small neutral amino acid transporter SnatA (MarC family)